MPTEEIVCFSVFLAHQQCMGAPCILHTSLRPMSGLDGDGPERDGPPCGRLCRLIKFKGLMQM